MFENRGAENI